MDTQQPSQQPEETPVAPVAPADPPGVHAEQAPMDEPVDKAQADTSKDIMLSNEGKHIPPIHTVAPKTPPPSKSDIDKIVTPSSARSVGEDTQTPGYVDPPDVHVVQMAKWAANVDAPAEKVLSVIKLADEHEQLDKGLFLTGLPERFRRPLLEDQLGKESDRWLYSGLALPRMSQKTILGIVCLSTHSLGSTSALTPARAATLTCLPSLQLRIFRRCIEGHPQPGVLYIELLAVLEDAAGMGVAKQLLTWADDKAVELNLPRIQVPLPASSHRFFSILRRHGYRVVHDSRDCHEVCCPLIYCATRESAYLVMERFAADPIPSTPLPTEEGQALLDAPGSQSMRTGGFEDEPTPRSAVVAEGESSGVGGVAGRAGAEGGKGLWRPTFLRPRLVVMKTARQVKGKAWQVKETGWRR
eukprot:jgi/Mesvir1/3828/Mv19796-RA.1